MPKSPGLLLHDQTAIIGASGTPLAAWLQAGKDGAAAIAFVRDCMHIIKSIRISLLLRSDNFITPGAACT